MIQNPSGGLPYKLYSAILTQTGTNPPVDTILYNDTGAVPLWSYDSTGHYTAVFNGAIPDQKATVLVGGTERFDTGLGYGRQRATDAVVVNSVLLDGGFTGNPVLSDDVLQLTSIEVHIYP